jgi:hypothetical protein
MRILLALLLMSSPPVSAAEVLMTGQNVAYAERALDTQRYLSDNSIDIELLPKILKDEAVEQSGIVIFDLGVEPSKAEVVEKVGMILDKQVTAARWLDNRQAVTDSCDSLAACEAVASLLGNLVGMTPTSARNPLDGNSCTIALNDRAIRLKVKCE